MGSDGCGVWAPRCGQLQKVIPESRWTHALTDVTQPMREKTQNSQLHNEMRHTCFLHIMPIIVQDSVTQTWLCDVCVSRVTCRLLCDESYLSILQLHHDLPRWDSDQFPFSYSPHSCLQVGDNDVRVWGWQVTSQWECLRKNIPRSREVRTQHLPRAGEHFINIYISFNVKFNQKRRWAFSRYVIGCLCKLDLEASDVTMWQDGS